MTSGSADAVIVLPCGPAAWLVEGMTDPAAWAHGLRRASLTGVIDVVPAERTVLVTCTAERHTLIRSRLDLIEPVPLDDVARTVVVEVTYDGDDLGVVAEQTGLSEREVVERHTAPTYVVAFCGFSPGFAYLRGLDPLLVLPRRSSPRTSVPTGSVAVAALYTAIYPTSSPGGWHLIGHTDLAVWTTARHPPALLEPGARVQFRQVGAIRGRR